MPHELERSSHSDDQSVDRSADSLLEYVRARLIADPDVHVDASTPLFEEGLINSINILALMGYVEKRIGRRLEDREIVMQHFRSVRTIAEAFLT